LGRLLHDQHGRLVGVVVPKTDEPQREAEADWLGSTLGLGRG
jgi:hypothetical protein